MFSALEAMSKRRVPTILAVMAYRAHIGTLTVIARLAAYTDVVDIAILTVVIVARPLVFVHRTR